MLPRPSLFARAATFLAAAALALLGWAAASALVARPAGACSCVEPTWTVRLESAVVAPPGDDHAQLWPVQGSLTAYEGTARIWNDQPAAGVVGVVGANR